MELKENEVIQHVQPDRLTRVDVLRRAEECVCGHREQDYGSPEDNFEAIADFWETYLNRGCLANDGRVHLDASDVAMMMALFKIALSIWQVMRPAEGSAHRYDVSALYSSH